MDGHRKVQGIKRHVLTCSLGLMLAHPGQAANVHDTQPVGALLDRAAEDGWVIERVQGRWHLHRARMAQAATEHGVDVQAISLRETPRSRPETRT